MNAHELLERLRRHYIKPGDRMAGGIFLPEVTLGRAGGSRADALYVGFTTTRGERLVGHELKVSRSDWQHELDQSGKADPWASQCHAWYVVAPSTEIVRPEELPDEWGLLVPNARTATRMDVVVRATSHPDRQPSWRAMHSIVKRQDTLAGALIYDAREAERAALQQRIRELEDAARLASPASRDRVHREHEERGRVLTELAAVLGVRGFTLDEPGWRWEQSPLSTAELRSAFTAFLAADMDATAALDQRRHDLEYATDSVKGALKALTEARSAIAAAKRTDQMAAAS